MAGASNEHFGERMNKIKKGLEAQAKMKKYIHSYL